MTKRLDIPVYAQELIALLEEAGFEAWCVGGFVRDALLGRPCHDVDLACSAHWVGVQKVCEAAGLKTYELGVKHGTLTVGFPAHENVTIEVTTYRTDGAYHDVRHPSEVTFVSTIEEDLARRDFTMNALAYHPQRGLLDPYGGIKDIQANIIRFVGDPVKRCQEDALRILRACRFASQLGFTLEDNTLRSVRIGKGLLRHVPVERITDELDRFLLGEYVHDALMTHVDTLAFVLPELVAMKGHAQDTPYHIYDVLEHTAYVVHHSPRTRLARWVALCHDMGKPAASFYDAEGVEHFYSHAAVSCVLAQGIMNRLLMSSAFKAQVLTLVKYHDDVIEPNARSVKRALMRLGGDTNLFRSLCDIKRADALSQAPQCVARVESANELERILDNILVNEEAFSIRDLAINGGDIMNAGVPQGPQVGELLTRALEAVINEEVANEQAELLAYLQLSTTY